VTSLLLGVVGVAASAAPPAAHNRMARQGQALRRDLLPAVDRSPEEIRKDIALMRAAGFTLVRMGDLSWDAFEPSEGNFQFAWFDEILEQMNEAGIKVILDIADCRRRPGSTTSTLRLMW